MNGDRFMSCRLVAYCGLIWCFTSSFMWAGDHPFPGEKSNWHGFDKYEFNIHGKQAVIVVPPKPVAGNPWVWHGEFFGHKPDPDIELLKRGFHIAYLKVPDMLGSPEAVNAWNHLYEELTGRYGLSKKVALVGLSRGGLYCYNWAAANPDKVACIYGDAPVCDFKSWPGGKGAGPGSPRDWQLVLERYGFRDEAEALAYPYNPVDNLAPLANAKVPLLHVYGDADEVVPWEENTGLVAQRYRALGGEITLIAKPGVKHHPHGLEDSTPIVAFIEKHSLAALASESVPTAKERAAGYQAVAPELFRERTGLGNFLAKAEKGGPVRVAYLGGSITAANGWRMKTLKQFQEDFPAAQFSEINAAIGGTGSDLGVFRVGHDVLQHHPDLLFVEFAVNDGGASPEQIWRCMEGIVRQTWRQNPETDICFVYTFRVGFEKDYANGVCPRSISAMEHLAEHYGIPSIDFASKIVEEQNAGRLVYQTDAVPGDGVVWFSTDGVHPLDGGHEIYAQLVREFVQKMKGASRPVNHQPQLNVPFVADNWEQAKMVPLTSSMLTGDWKELAADAPLSKSFSNRMGTIWEARTPGSQLTFRFRGSTAKVYDLLGPDGGQVRITIDGVAREKPVPRFDSYCTYHRIATLGLAEGLDPNEVHTVQVELLAEQPDRSIVAFRLKDPETELKSPKYQGTNLRFSHILVLGDVLEE